MASGAGLEDTDQLVPAIGGRDAVLSGTLAVRLL